MGRKMRYAAVLGAVVVTALLAAGLLDVSIAAARGAGSPVPPGAALTNTALGGFTQLDQIDMVSPKLGYALATRFVGKGRYRYFLVRTTDAAKTWTVRSELLADTTRYPIFTDFDTDDSDPTIDFVSRDVGYVDGPGSTIEMTVDGGLDWARLVAKSTSSSYGVSGTTTSVVTSACAGGPTAAALPCTTVLREFAVGSLAPKSTNVIPVGKSVGGWTVGLLASAPDQTDVVNIDSGELSTASSLLITHDGGRAWSILENPCRQSLILQMVVANDGQWLLSCFHDDGMYHGTARIFRSVNKGASWATVLDDTPQRNLVGDLGATPVYLFFSGDDRILYGAMMNPAGGLEVSLDGGTHWHRESELGYSGGSPGSITNLNATSSLYQVFEGGAYVTNNLRAWRLLPALPAGPYRGLDICTKASTTVSLRHVRYGGLTYTYVDFTNRGGASCYLDGVPSLQALNAQGRAVGPAGTTTSNPDGGDFVILTSKGGVASDSLMIDPTSTLRPASTCAAAKADALRISFGAPSSFRLSLRRDPVSVCTRMPSISLVWVRKGPGRP